MQHSLTQTIEITHASDVYIAREAVKNIALEIGFAHKPCGELELVVTELATNLVKHAQFGSLTIKSTSFDGCGGIQIETYDKGPGIQNVDQAMCDGYSSIGSFGYGLGTINRIVDEFVISSKSGENNTTYMLCKKWLPDETSGNKSCPLTFGIASRAHPQCSVNGDAFVVKKGNKAALVAVIDGLGHGQLAHLASQKARSYIENHFEQPLLKIFQGVDHTCQSTRGVVMALARFDWEQMLLSFASVGNIDARVFGSSEPTRFIFRRGIVGRKAPNPKVTQHRWEEKSMLILFSDGLKNHWTRDELAQFPRQPVSSVAHRLLRKYSRDNDDATVIVVGNATP